MKKRISLLLFLALLCALLTPAALAVDGINVTFNGQEVVWTDARPFVDANFRTLVPLRAVGEAMGFDVDWDGATSTASFSRSGSYDDGTSYVHTLHFIIDHNIATWDTQLFNADGQLEEGGFSEIEMDTAAVAINGRTYAPVRYLAEAFGYEVRWSGETNTVVIEEKTYILRWDFFANWEDYVGIYYCAGERFDELGAVETVSATINDMPMEFEVLSAEALGDLNDEFGDALNGEAVYAFYIYSDFEFEYGETYFIEWEAAMTYADGSEAEPQIITWVYEHYGVGGY